MPRLKHRAEEKMAQHSAPAGGADPSEPSLEELGTLVLRVWKEPGAEHGVRIRVLTSDGAWEPADLKVTPDPEAAVKSVRDWLGSRIAERHAGEGTDRPM
ncbi:MAG: hypothetical protein HOQ07_07210 [Sinomonas sp.]|nr:hypothetical protein [Sinomonas sp.]